MFGNYQWDQPVKTAARIISDKSEDYGTECRDTSMTNPHCSSDAPIPFDSQRHYPSSKTTNKKGVNNKRHQDTDLKRQNREIQRRYRENSKMKAAEAEDALEKLCLDLQEAQEEKAALLAQATVLGQVNDYLGSVMAAISDAGSKAAQTIIQVLPSLANYATSTPLELLVEHGIFPPDFVIRRHLRVTTLDVFEKKARMFYNKVNELVQQWNEDPSSRQLVEQKLEAYFNFIVRIATIVLDERPDVMDALIFSGDNNATVSCTPDVPVDLLLSAQQMVQLQVALQEFKAKQAILNEYNNLATQSLIESVDRSLKASSIKDQFSAHISTSDATSRLEAQNIQRLHDVLNLYKAVCETFTPIQMGQFLVTIWSLNGGLPYMTDSRQASFTYTLNLLDKFAEMGHTENDGHQV
jgi:hypothetical protein